MCTAIKDSPNFCDTFLGAKPDVCVQTGWLKKIYAVSLQYHGMSN